jgi:hypothetical protein
VGEKCRVEVCQPPNGNIYASLETSVTYGLPSVCLRVSGGHSLNEHHGHHGAGEVVPKGMVSRLSEVGISKDLHTNFVVIDNTFVRSVPSTGIDDVRAFREVGIFRHVSASGTYHIRPNETHAALS